MTCEFITKYGVTAQPSEEESVHGMWSVTDKTPQSRPTSCFTQMFPFFSFLYTWTQLVNATLVVPDTLLAP